MKKILLVVLCAVAIPLYTYNILLLTKTSLPWRDNSKVKAAEPTRLSFKQLLVAATPPRFEEVGRDPFTLRKKKKAVAPVKKNARRISRPVKKEVAPPKLTVAGIMWHPDRPVAMLKTGSGRTKTVKNGQELSGGIIVVSIGKKSVVVVKEGKKFTIEK